MLSHQILTRQDIGDVAAYYGDAADDYYAKEGEAQVWQGRGAEELGLTGEVDRQRFRELLAGKIDPDGPSVRLTTRDDSKNRIAIDLTFSAPKSVSIHALVGGDAAMIAAHDLAVSRALEAAERLAQARVKVDGKTRLETTGNLIIAKFRHETTRAQDPELHTHAVVMNLTQRTSDGKWRALRNDEIIQATKFLGAVYRTELANELQRHGHTLRFGREGMFELASMTREQIMAFSQRSAAIEAALAAQGLTRETATTEQIQAATMRTRDKKDASLDRDALYSEWRSRAAELGIELDGNPTARAQAAAAYAARYEQDQADASSKAVLYAIEHIAERDAILTKSAIVDVALKHSIGQTTLFSINDAIAREVDAGTLVQEIRLYRPAGAPRGPQLSEAGWIHALEEVGIAPELAAKRVRTAISSGGLALAEARYATPAALARETKVLAIEKQGRGKVQPILSLQAATAHFAKQQLNDGQRKAAVLMLTTSNRVVGIEGYAGVGKSHMLDKAKNKLLADAKNPFLDQGYKFRALAPYGTQVKALRELGVEANTVASFLAAKNKKIDNKTVLVIDEAGTVPARQMADILAIAEAAGARVVLVGDRAQTKAIEAGRPFDQLIRAGMQTERMTEIQRQKDPTLKAAVELAAVGDTKGSLEKIANVIEIQNDQERHRAVAMAYATLAPDERNKTIIVSGTNQARRAINDGVRTELGLAGNGRLYDLLIRRDTTQAERKFSQNYNIGDTVLPDKDYRRVGLVKGELYRVVENGPGNKLRVQSATGQTLEFSPFNVKLSVYETRRDELSKGDLVKVTHNDAALDLANGQRFRVAAVTPKAVTLTDGKRTVTLPADRPIHVDHAYATTVHSSQGLTENRTIYDVNVHSRTTKQDVWYVAISRARYDVQVFTNSKERLAPAIARMSVKHAALDLQREDRAERGRKRDAIALFKARPKEAGQRERA